MANRIRKITSPANGSGSETQEWRSEVIARILPGPIAANLAPGIFNIQGDNGLFVVNGSSPALLDRGGDASVTDADSANFDGGTLTVSITTNKVAGEDQLGLDPTAGPAQLTGNVLSVNGVNIGTVAGGGAGGGDFVITFNANATPARVETVFWSLSYNNSNASPSPATRGFTITLVDGDGTAGGGDDSTSVTTTVTFLFPNVAPAGTDITRTISEGNPIPLQVSEFGFTDSDGNQFLAVKITTLPTNGKLELDGVPVAAGDTVTVAAIMNNLLVFTPDPGESGSPYATFTFQVQDNGGTGAGGADLDPTPNSYTINVIPGQQDPVLDLDMGAAGSDVVLSYPTNNPPTLIAPAATLTDADTPNFNGGTLTVSFTANGTADDQLGIRNEGTGAGQIGVSGANVSFGGTVIGTFTGGANGTNLVITLDADATSAATQALFRNLTYATTGSPSTLARSVNFVLNTGDGGTDMANATINFTNPVDDAPTIAATAQNPTFVEGGAAVDIFSAVTASTIEAGQTFTSMTLTVTNVLNPGSEVLFFDGSDVALNAGNTVATLGNGLMINVAMSGSTATVSFSGASLSAATLQSIIDNFTYRNVASVLADADRVVTITELVDSGSSTPPNSNTASPGITSTVNVNPAGGAPPVAQPDAVTTDEATTLNGNVFSNNGSGADSDPDGPALSVSAVNGSAGSVGNQIMLASGALLTLNANGTFSYNPNGAFNPTPTAGSGATNTPALDSFTYTLTGGNTVTVTVTVTGLDTNDLLVGGAGADTMMGGLGNDTYILGPGDTAVEAVGQGSDAVAAGFSYTLAAGNEIELLTTGLITGTAAITFNGNEFGNQIWGNNGANTLSGGGGNDILLGFGGNDILGGGPGVDAMLGGDGDDRYVVDNAGDVVSEAVGGGNDTVTASVSYALVAGSEIELMTTGSVAGTGSINLTGNELANQIWGNAAANTLNGGGGADILIGFGGDDTLVGGAGVDTMLGGLGNDTYFVDNSADALYETAGEGSDVVATTVDFVLTAGSEVELMTAGGVALTNTVSLTGNELANQIWGNNGVNVVNGGAGNDVLFGFGGADTFAFTTALGAGNVDAVLDYSVADDSIQLDDAVFTGLALGALNPNAFVNGAAALDADDRIIYNQATGQLYYDADGNGAGAAVLFATFNGNPVLTAGEFTVI